MYDTYMMSTHSLLAEGKSDYSGLDGVWVKLKHLCPVFGGR